MHGHGEMLVLVFRGGVTTRRFVLETPGHGLPYWKFFDAIERAQCGEGSGPWAQTLESISSHPAPGPSPYREQPLHSCHSLGSALRALKCPSAQATPPTSDFSLRAGLSVVLPHPPRRLQSLRGPSEKLVFPQMQG